MRKSILALGLLLLTCLAGLTAAHHVLRASEETVTLSAVTLAGDPAAAADLRLRFGRQLRHQLFWDVDTQGGNVRSCRTRFSRSPDYGPSESSFSGVLLFPMLNNGISGPDVELPDPSLGPLNPLCIQAAEHTAPGKTHLERFTLTDVLDHYPLSFQVDIPGNPDLSPWHDGTPEEQERSAFLSILADAFPIPIAEGHAVDVTAVRDPEGKLLSVDVMDAVDGISLRTACPSAVGTDRVYFLPVLCAGTGDKEALLDYSHTPGGYGIYTLPCADRPLTKDDIYFFYAPPKDFIIQDLVLNPNGDRLLVELTGPDGRDSLAVLDPASGETLQTLSFPGGLSIVSLLQDGEQLLVDLADEVLWFYTQDAQGVYGLQFTLDLPEHQAFAVSGWNGYAAAFDGTRLALACVPSHSRTTGAPYTAALLTADRSGLLYAGTVRCSLDIGEYQAPSGVTVDPCLPAHPALSIRWP